jgi:hypothetical protein
VAGACVFVWLPSCLGRVDVLVVVRVVASGVVWVVVRTGESENIPRVSHEICKVVHMIFHVTIERRRGTVGMSVGGGRGRSLTMVRARAARSHSRPPAHSRRAHVGRGFLSCVAACKKGLPHLLRQCMRSHPLRLLFGRPTHLRSAHGTKDGESSGVIKVVVCSRWRRAVQG